MDEETTLNCHLVCDFFKVIYGNHISSWSAIFFIPFMKYLKKKQFFSDFYIYQDFVFVELFGLCFSSICFCISEEMCLTNQQRLTVYFFRKST